MARSVLLGRGKQLNKEYNVAFLIWALQYRIIKLPIGAMHIKHKDDTSC